MKLTYRNLFTDKNKIDYSVVKNGSSQFLCLQGKKTAESRIKKAYMCASFFYPELKEHFPEPISFNSDDENNLCTALFSYSESGFLTDFLSVVPREWQYATGRKLGRILKEMHSVSLTKSQNDKAVSRHERFMENLAEYISALPHFKNDKYALEALSQRFDNFGVFRTVMRYGSLNHGKVLITRDSSLIMLPSYTFGPGDACEDFAMLEFETAGLYPLFCAGVVDGYFSGVIPSVFWTRFALYCAMYSLWKSGKIASKSKAMFIKMQQNVDRIRDDFSDFQKPIPKWYSVAELKTIKAKARKL